MNRYVVAEQRMEQASRSRARTITEDDEHRAKRRREHSQSRTALSDERSVSDSLRTGSDLGHARPEFVQGSSRHRSQPSTSASTAVVSPITSITSLEVSAEQTSPAAPLPVDEDHVMDEEGPVKEENRVPINTTAPDGSYRDPYASLEEDGWSDDYNSEEEQKRVNRVVGCGSKARTRRAMKGQPQDAPSC